MVLPDDPATQPGLDDLQDHLPLRVLADVKLRAELPADPTARVALDRDGEAALSVHEACDVGVQPFLLIDRTGQIITSHAIRQAKYCRILGVPSI